MLRYLKHTEITKKKWDECIAASHNCRVYVLSWYLDVVCPGWEAIVEDDYSAVIPLTSKKKYGIHYLFQPHHSQQLGIFSKEKISVETIENFLNAIPEKFKFAEICINSENSEILLPSPLLSERSRTQGEGLGLSRTGGREVRGFSLKKNLNYELSLNKNYKEIYKNYSENTRRNIKKATKSGVVISSENVAHTSIINVFRKNKGKEFSHLKNDYYHLMNSVIEVCKKKADVKIISAFDNIKKLCAGAIFIIYQQKAIFLFSATNQTAKDNGAMFLLIDAFLRQYSETLAVLDFEGSNDANLARFYKSFGAKEYVYLQLRKNNLPKYLRWLKQ